VAGDGILAPAPHGAEASPEMSTTSLPDSPSVAHQPVMREQVVRLLTSGPAPTPPRERRLRLVDATLGDGGHAAALLDSAPDAELLGIDRDPQALPRAAARLARFGERARCVRARFSELAQVLDSQGWQSIDGLVADLGVSSLQLDLSSRGFSFRQPAPLDMRMDPSTGESAADLLQRLTEQELADVLHAFGEEPRARAIARAIDRAKQRGAAPLSTDELQAIVARVVHAGAPRRSLRDPATRTFQALRIAVNHELDELDELLAELPHRLAPGARVAVLAYHSLEDRRVKQRFRSWTARCSCPPELPRCVCGGVARALDLTRGALQPDAEEIARNPRSRSARLRAVAWLGRTDAGSRGEPDDAR
jgi:16S rRNA (cytosine1402-N4)-methyltransferase